MKILIISDDNFFISGIITLISQSKRKSVNPKFIFSNQQKITQKADVIIRDIYEKNWLNKNNSLLEGNSRHVTLSFMKKTPLDSEKNNISRYEHFLIFDKKESASYLSMLFKLIETKQSSLFHDKKPVITLSKQQSMVVKYTREGLSLTDISRLTRLSIKTISTHKQAVMRKLGIKNNSDFYQYALSCQFHCNDSP